MVIFFNDDGWLMVLWNKSFGYNMTFESCFNFGDGTRKTSIIAVNIVRLIGKDGSPLGYPKQEKSGQFTRGGGGQILM